MIVRLLPTQVTKFWDLVKPAVLEVGGRLAPGDWDLANNALHMCLAGLLQVWILEEEGEQREFKGVVITSITKEDVSRRKALTLWLLFFYKQPSLELVSEGREALKTYARSNGCDIMLLQQLHAMSDDVVAKWWEGKFTKRSIYTLHL